MSGKRSRATYEADLQSQQSPYVVWGTPLPPRDPDVRDDGSYVPVWKQEVRDERGLKRLHGAFTGGFSAGYFNTVGSKEGWAPSTFVSSRSNRKKDDPKSAQQRPEDFMDDEDIADAAEAQRVQTAEGFAGLGSTEDDATRRGAFVDLFRTDGETIGVKLLKKMGWKEGQGIGPKVRRKARLDGMEQSGGLHDTTHLFAPENTHMIRFVRKNDHKGLGFDSEEKLLSTNIKELQSDDEDESSFASQPQKLKKKKPARGGIGIGILNDTGSDDEDPYEIGPRISYNRVIGADKKKKKASNGAINPLLKSKPVFISKKAAMSKASSGARKCHDGRFPLDGFILSNSDPSTHSTQDFLVPSIPEGWVSVKEPKAGHQASVYLSTADAAKASQLDPKSRASILGEAPLPGKSVFDFLTPSARERLASASGKSNLPAALGEIPAGYNMTDEERQKELLDQIPKIEKDVAIAALTRGASGFMPYGEDLDKRERYRAYLEYQADITTNIPERRPGTTKNNWLKELKEFCDCAQIFKPMTSMMASRFTVSTTAPKLASDGPETLTDSLLSKPASKPEDPAEAAAKVGMYGPLTRSSQDFYPTRLLCKRFNIKPPAHVQPDAGEEGVQENKNLDIVSKTTMEDIWKESGSGMGQQGKSSASTDAPVDEKPMPVVVDTEINEALEGPKPGMDVFKAIFGDDSEDEVNGYDLRTMLSGTQETTGSLEAASKDEAPSSPPGYPVSESSTSSPSPRPPPFSSLYTSTAEAVQAYKSAVTEASASASASVPAYTSVVPQPHPPSTSSPDVVADTKAALPHDTKGESSKKDEDVEPPPAYSEGFSPLESFSYLMAAAGGAASIITQVQQGGAAPINTLGDVGADENITMDLRGTRFTLSRDELLTLPEFVLLSLFPNGLLPDGHMSNYHEGDAFQVDYDPASLQYMLEFFRNVAQTIPSDNSRETSPDGEAIPIEPMAGSAREMLQDRAGIIVLREDLDFYAIPPRPDIEQPEMIEVKRAAGKALLKQDGIFSGLRRSEESGTTEQHLIEMLTAGGFNHDDHWGHRAGEPNKAVICSLALARLRTDVRGGDQSNMNAVGMAQKLLLFWRKPARRCWWEGVELENVEGVEGKLKVWIRRVWTLEMSVIGLR
ncbi:g-patch domain containing protein [Phlyctema vagabunda]|uniref:G-patch domain containing protein n=1 Tax=Phlyctema vagabunda TaxID=108571 RepID=A0ABR4PBY2_9HELO